MLDIGLNIAHKFNIYFNSGIEDNSDLASHIDKGTYFRQDLTFYTDDAYLWRANYQELVKIDTNLSFSYNPSQAYDEGIINTTEIDLN